MSFRLNHNIRANNSLRNLEKNQSDPGKPLETILRMNKEAQLRQKNRLLALIGHGVISGRNLGLSTPG
ncbi:hypothetical protein KKA14_11175 [bacterium]|nr:hypothetical protein [bacterium]